MDKKQNSKKFWDYKIVWAIIALLASVVLWVYVTITEGDLVPKSFSGISIEFTGRDALREEKDLIITEVSASTVSVSVKGSRREVSALDASSMTAVIDVSKVTLTGRHTTAPTIVFASGTSTSTISAGNVTVSPSTVTYTIEREVTKTIDVKGVFNGSVVEGYIPSAPTFEPSSVIIRGPQSEVDKVAYAWVDITNQDVSSTINYAYAYELVDSEYNPVAQGNIELDRESVMVTMVVMASMEVPLRVNTPDGAGLTSENLKKTYEPESIVIAGEKELLDEITSIELDTLDLSSFELTYEETYEIANALPDGVTNVSGITTAKVTVQVIGREVKTFAVSNITVVNVTDGYKAEVLSESVEVRIRGPADVLSEIKPNNIRIVADAVDIGSTEGEFAPNAKVIIDGYTGVGAVGECKVYIRISRG